MKNPFNQLIDKFLSSSPKMSEKEITALKDLTVLDDLIIGSLLEEAWNKYTFQDSNSYSHQKLYIKSILDKKNQVINTKKSVQFNWKIYSIAASIVILISFSGMYFFNTIHTNASVQYITVTTKAGEKFSVTLPDGSKVQLNSASKLIYPIKFKSDERVVSMNGEDFFNVEKEKDRKFVVKTNTHNIEVMGTTFNVRNYNSDAIFEVVLLTGKVKVKSTNENSGDVILLPNEKYIVELKSKDITISQINADSETAWLRNEIVFKNEKLNDVITKLERFYGVEISTSNMNDVNNYAFTGRFRDEKIEKILEILAVHFPIKYQIENKHIAISPKK